MSFLPALKFWLILSTAATAAGWILSAFHRLDEPGYGLVVLLGAALFLFIRWRSLGSKKVKDRRKLLLVLRTRFSRFFPAAFLILSFLILLGGLLYPPSNHTAVTYRLPRVLHWLANHQWHWIEHTENYRMNNRACGIEWLSAPLVLFLRSDRALFLLNFIPFLMLPGLIFSLFVRLGVRRRVAWHWMWLLPTGYTFVLQAGSTGNDTFPTVYGLAAVDFACRAWTTRKPVDLWYSLLSASLLTGAKASNLPLLLPWFVLAVVLWRLWLVRPLGTAMVAAVAALVSFMPTAVLNVVYCGDWSGLTLERTGMDMKNPIVGIWGNTVLFAFQNFVPPFFPAAGAWNRSALTILPQALVRPLVSNFEQGFHQVWEMPSEDWVGLGLGVSLLLLVSWLGARRYRSAPTTQSPENPAVLAGTVRILVLFAPWFALLAFCMKSGMVTGARLISPYYPLLAPVLLLGFGQAVLTRQRWWRWLAAMVVLLSFPVLILTPGRPLWPAQTWLAWKSAQKPENRLVTRALKVYRTYSIRSDPMAGVRAQLPPGVKRIGFIGAPDDPDLSLWRPFGSGRRVEHILCQETGSAIRSRKIEYALVGGLNLEQHQISLEKWLRQTGAKLLFTSMITVKVTEGPQAWYLVRFSD